MANKKSEEKVFNINDYKGEIDKYIKERVEIESASNVVKIYKKQLRDKTVISTIKSIIIIILLLIMVYAGYLFYRNGYLDRDRSQVNPSEQKREVIPDSGTNNKEEKENEEESDKKKQELIAKYSYLLKNINVDSKCDYLKDFYNGKLTDEMREYLAFTFMDTKKVLIDDSSIIFEGKELMNSYKSLFGDEIKPIPFKYNGASFKYLELKDMFISTGLSTKGYEIVRKVVDVNEDNKKIVLSTVEGYINNNKIYNILTNKEVGEYKANTNIDVYTNKLNSIKYVFNDGVLSELIV